MNIADLINGSYEILGGFFILTSINKLHKEKQVHGVSWVHAGFFATWGYWNLYYYPYLGQTWSFIGGIGVVVTNTIWLIQLIYYSKRGKK
jgi:hypothetical protein